MSLASIIMLTLGLAALAFVIFMGLSLAAYSAVGTAYRLDDMMDDQDAFGASMQRYGYIQETRNEGGE